MAILKGNSSAGQYAEEPAIRKLGKAALSELALRNSIETNLRVKFPQGRIYHEMMMGARQVRADLVAIEPNHMAAVEIKGSYDDTRRLLHQVGMYQLCVPEVWIVAAEKHLNDALLIKHLLPSTGIYVEAGAKIELLHEAEPRKVVPEMTLEMLWSDELGRCCNRAEIKKNKATNRRTMIGKLLNVLSYDEIISETCRELRQRDGIFRADPRIVIE